MEVEMQIEMQVQMAPQLHARVCCGAAVWGTWQGHGGTWGRSLATAAFSTARRTWRFGAARVSYLSADEKSLAVVKASQFA